METRNVVDIRQGVPQRRKKRRGSAVDSVVRQQSQESYYIVRMNAVGTSNVLHADLLTTSRGVLLP